MKIMMSAGEASGDLHGGALAAELKKLRPDIELFGMYKERRAQGYTHEELMESIYAKTRDNARTPMQWDTTEQADLQPENRG